MEVFVSTINFWRPDQKKLSEIVPQMLDAGINKIEISSIHPHEPGIDNLLFEWGKDARLLVHNFAPPIDEKFVLNLSSQSPEIRKKTVDFIELTQDYFNSSSSISSKSPPRIFLKDVIICSSFSLFVSARLFCSPISSFRLYSW